MFVSKIIIKATIRVGYNVKGMVVVMREIGSNCF